MAKLEFGAKYEHQTDSSLMFKDEQCGFCSFMSQFILCSLKGKANRRVTFYLFLSFKHETQMKQVYDKDAEYLGLNND